MNEIKFKIFTKTKKFHLSVNLIVYSLLFTSISIIYLANKYFEESTLESIGQAGGISACVLMIYFIITQSFTKKKLNGTLNEYLIFRETEILTHKTKYKLDDISKIKFSVGDYYYRWIFRVKGNFNPGRSNGVENSCEIDLINGEKIVVYFQLMYKNEFHKMHEILIHFYTQNKISFLKLIEYLEIENYDEIQEFKKHIAANHQFSTS